MLTSLTVVHTVIQLGYHTFEFPTTSEWTLHKLQHGVIIERILDDIRDSVTDKLGQKHLVTRQDLHIVKAQFNIDGIIRYKNDLTSVMAWVEEMSMLDYNPVLAGIYLNVKEWVLQALVLTTFCLFCRLTFNMICLNSLVPMQYALTQHMDQIPLTLILHLLS